MQLNEEQKKAAFCSDNAVVSAGAGSGKTLVLANRFVWLLTEKNYKVDEILTLTFTKKAASQMFRRIYSLVSEIACGETADEASRIKAQRAKQALDDFIHARIQTIDSYSASIVKQCSVRYGISPDFQIDQDRCYSLALEVSYPFLIANRHHPAVKALYSDNRPNDIVNNIFANVLFDYCFIDKPRDFSSDVKIQFDALCSEWENRCKEIKKILSEIENDISQDEKLLPILVPIIEKYRKEKIEMPKTIILRKYLDKLLNTPLESVMEEAQSHPLQKEIISFLYFLDSICVLNLRGGKKNDNPVKENIKKLREIYESISSLSISCMQAGFIISIMSLLTELQDKYLSKKRAEGVLTFKDIASLSRTILIEQRDIRKSEKEAFKAIMIDEFQDNNELQKDILFLLAEKHDITSGGIPKADNLNNGKLFFVGDEKQSIYLFRGADVSVFRKLKEEIGSSDLPLKTNYRSTEQLISAFNKIFPSVFASYQSLPHFEAGYAPLEAGYNKEKIKKSGLSLFILNKKAETEDEEDELLLADENEARFVCAKIKQLLNENYKPDEIAILFRSRSSQYLYEKHLRILNIPYASEDINDLFYAGPVNDILSVLRLASHPVDKAAYAEMLRSPFAGLSLSGTAVCLSTETPFDDAVLSRLDETDSEKFRNGKNIYLSICKKCENESISSLVSDLWYKEGYRYETEWNAQTSAYRELFDYLFHLAANADKDNQTLASFTDSMISIRDSGGRLPEIDIPLVRSGAVHLMTIHKSKGLEFPVVFLCGCGKKSQTDRCDVTFFSETAGVIFSPPPPSECRSICPKRSNFFWEHASEEARRKRTAELRRLLYVGMTRAENELYITGSFEIKANDDIDNFSLLLKDHIENQCDKKENYIEGDKIIDNDTLFGLLLPSIIDHIPDDGIKNDKSFFRLEEIKRVTQDSIQIEDQNIKGFANNSKGLNEFFNIAQTYYKKTDIIKTPDLRDNHITPVSLKNETEDEKGESPGKNYLISSEFSGVKSDDIFKKVDSMLSRLSQNSDEESKKFNSGSFGTIAHACVEAALNREETVIPSNISSLLSPLEFSALLDAGNEIAGRFVSSPLGKIAQNAALRESEFNFRSLIKNKKGEAFINGTIDLFFEDKNAIHIVDFKTDSRELPGEHCAQMSCYYHAVSSLFAVPAKKQCRVWLYYLRTGHAVEMTEKAVQFNLEQRAFSML